MTCAGAFRIAPTALKAAMVAAFAMIDVTASAQQLVADNSSVNSVEPGLAATTPALPEAPESHRFWDTENKLLFAGVAAANTGDFAVTYRNLQNGGKELNPITRIFAGTTAGLAVNFIGETAATMGIAYWFHKTGHHKLERATSAVATTISLQAMIYSGIQYSGKRTK
jgi:hypothetical protein